MKHSLILICGLCLLTFYSFSQPAKMEKNSFKPFKTPINLEVADKRADSILSLMTIEEKIEMPIRKTSDDYPEEFYTKD